MNNPAIAQALFELEESLAQIKSANNSVNEVSQKSESLIANMSRVINALNSISENINIDKEAIYNQISKNSKSFEIELSKILKGTEDNSNEIAEVLNTNQKIFIENLEQTSSRLISELTKSISKFEVITKEAAELLNKEFLKLIDAKDKLAAQLLIMGDSYKNFEIKINEINFKKEFENIELKYKNSTRKLLLISFIANIIILGGIAFLAVLFWFK